MTTLDTSAEVERIRALWTDTERQLREAREAGAALIDAIATPHGRDFGAAWEHACTALGRHGSTPTLIPSPEIALSEDDDPDDADSPRIVANDCAAHIRERADTHSGVHDEGGDVDERELLWCAQRVDRCTTLGELEELVARWREVA